MKDRHLQNRSFGKFRNFFWPIHGYELKKLLPMFMLFFLISFAYNLLRCLKISLIVTAEGSGAEVIPYLKTGAVLPGALLLTYIFTKLISHFDREQVFYTILLLFMAYFALFLFVLFPNHSHLQLDALADFLQAKLLVGEGFAGLIACVRHMNLTLFYVLAEMWSAVVLSMLFWGFANEVTKVDEAKRFYAIFALGANCSGIFSGLAAHWIKGLPYIAVLPFDASRQWIFFQLMAVLLAGGLIIALFYWLNRSVFHMENVSTIKIPKKAKKISLGECFSYLKKSRYLAYIVTIVVAYNIVYNLADVMWTYKIKQVYPDSGAFNAYMNQITSLTGIVAVIFAFLVSGNVIRYYGWTVAALITPIIWLLSGSGFFVGLLIEGNSSSLVTQVLSTLASNPANAVLLLGSIQICLGRGCKYTVFDETKEIAFIPLPKKNQRKGKAIVDGLASRFGKSGGSFIYLALFMAFGEIAHTIPYVTAIILISILLWISAVVGLGRMVSSKVDSTTDLVIESDSEAGEEEEGIIAAQQS